MRLNVAVPWVKDQMEVFKHYYEGYKLALARFPQLLQFLQKRNAIFLLSEYWAAVQDIARDKMESTGEVLVGPFFGHSEVDKWWAARGGKPPFLTVSC